MMKDIEEAFRVFLTRIGPPDTQMMAAQSGHTTLRERLQQDPYFGDLIETTFLNGSYARRTVVRPIKDVDIVAVVGEDWLNDDPAQAMEALRRKLAQWYNGRRTRRRRRAVQVELSRIKLDVLLAAAPDGLDHPLQIPDRQERQWIQTHPKMQLKLAEQLQTRTGGNYTKLVRLLKAWALNRMAVAYKPRSFVLECSTYHVIAESPAAFLGPLDEAFVTLLERLRAWNFGRSDWFVWDRPAVPDPALPDINVAERWSADGADAVQRGLELALRRCAAVEKARWQDTAIGKWGTVFGGSFPAPSAIV